MIVALSALESQLYESANTLRGSVDAADFRTYIFPLLSPAPARRGETVAQEDAVSWKTPL
jgi:hypothetical protein